MSVWAKLYETYPKILSDKENNDLKDVDKYLLRDGLTVNNCGLEITLDANSNIINMALIPKDNQKTIIPVTPDSIKRSGSTVAPNPLFEKLDYMASDWDLIIKDDKLLEKNNSYEKYSQYIETLRKWVEFSQFPQIKIIYNFIKNTNLIEQILSRFDIKDLIKVSKKDKSEEAEDESIEENNDNPIIEESINNELITSIENTQKDEALLLKNIQIAGKNFKKLADIFVRFSVQYSDTVRPEVYYNSDLFNEWCKTYKQILGLEEQSDLDYISGDNEVLQSYFPKKIRNQGDGARIISANDKTIRTFGGRFEPKVPMQVAPLGQKSMTQALYALSWLIKNNGAFTYDGLVVLAWSIDYIREENLYNVFAQAKDEKGKYVFNLNSNKAIEALAYYGNRSSNLDKLTAEHKVNVLVLDGESKGRIAVTYYNEIDSTIYYKNLENWFKTLQWQWLNYDTKEFEIRTPNFRSLFDLLYAENKQDKTLYKQFYKQILPCVVEGKQIPKYFVQRAFEKVRKPESFRDMQGKPSKNMWLNAIDIACAVINKYKKQKGKYMKLDLEENDRSYLFGRLLALAEKVENAATNYGGQTNAERLFTRFTMRPGQTFSTLQKQLAPYFDKLYGQGKAGLANYFKNEIAEVLDKMSKEDFASNKGVDEMFILGYYGQRNYREDKNIEEQNEIQGEE